MRLGEKIMRLGKKTSRAISIALLAAMASTSLPQVDVLAAVKNGMFLSVSYADKDKNDNDKEGTENTSPDESKQSEDAEPVQNEETGAASNSGVQENSEEQSSQNTTNGSSQKSILQVLCKYKIVQKNLFKWTELNSVRFYVIRKISTCQ